MVDENKAGEIAGLAVLEALARNKALKSVYLTTTEKVAEKDSRIVKFI